MKRTSTPLEWAQLAYCANGPDPLFNALLQKLTAHEILTILLQSLTHSSALKLLTDRLVSFATDNSMTLDQEFYRNLNHHCSSWQKRAHTFISCSNDEILDILSCNGKYHLIDRESSSYPHAFRDIDERTSSASPLCLWVDGTPQAFDSCQGITAVVGSRESDDYGQTCAYDLAQRCSSRGLCVASGGAMGIDASAHWGALNYSNSSSLHTPTIAFFAGGLRHIGPTKNMHLFEEIIHSHGALVSELPPDTIPYPSRFLHRNRLIAAISDCTVVAQARYRSGAINTAQWASEMGRVVAAIPGNINSPAQAGCNKLIRQQKAVIMTDISDIDDLVAVSHQPELFTSDVMSESPNSLSLSDSILTVLKRHRNVTVDDLAIFLEKEQKSNANTIDPPSINQAVGLLEIQGILQRTPDGRLHIEKMREKDRC